MNEKKHEISFGNAMRRIAAVFLVVLVLAAGAAGGLFAKYILSDNTNESAALAKMGAKVKVLEHAAEETGTNSGVYQLNTTEVESNDYKKVLPGVDIPKDPFVRLELNAEVSYELYVTVTETNFPTYTMKVGEKAGETIKDIVTYQLKSEWGEKPVDTSTTKDSDGNVVTTYTYKYNKVFAAGTPFQGDIYILVGDENVDRLKNGVIKISQYYNDSETGETFSLTFEAYLKQAQ